MSKSLLAIHPTNKNASITVWKENGIVVVKSGLQVIYEDANPLDVSNLIDDFKVNRRLIPSR